MVPRNNISDLEEPPFILETGSRVKVIRLTR